MSLPYIEDVGQLPDWLLNIVAENTLTDAYNEFTVDDFQILDQFDEFVELDLGIDPAELYTNPEDYGNMLSEFIERQIERGEWRIDYSRTEDW